MTRGRSFATSPGQDLGHFGLRGSVAPCAKACAKRQSEQAGQGQKRRDAPSWSPSRTSGASWIAQKSRKIECRRASHGASENPLRRERVLQAGDVGRVSPAVATGAAARPAGSIGLTLKRWPRSGRATLVAARVGLGRRRSASSPACRVRSSAPTPIGNRRGHVGGEPDLHLDAIEPPGDRRDRAAMREAEIMQRRAQAGHVARSRRAAARARASARRRACWMPAILSLSAAISASRWAKRSEA